MDIHAAVREVLVVGFAAGLAFSSIWGAVRVGYQRARGKPMPRTPVVLAIDGFVEALPNFFGVANKWLPLLGGPVIFLPAATPEAPDPQSNPARAPDSAPQS